MQPSPINKCWVCVLSDATNHRYEVRLTGDIRTLSGSASTEGGGDGLRLVYSRAFDDTLSALGYKIVLSKLSRRSLEGVINDHTNK